MKLELESLSATITLPERKMFSPSTLLGKDLVMGLKICLDQVPIPQPIAIVRRMWFFGSACVRLILLNKSVQSGRWSWAIAIRIIQRRKEHKNALGRI